MLKLHIVNTFFEWELETNPKCPLSEGFSQHPIFRQLQFLPLLYATSGEGILLADHPENGYLEKMRDRGILLPHLFNLSEPFFKEQMEIESWGASQLIAKFAKKHSLVYDIPDFALLRQVNSKRFSFECSHKLSLATLLENETEAKRWLESFQGKKVLKTCYGVSGKGHLIIDHPSYSWERITSFLKREWNKELPVIAEPWVERILDFSTQWLVHKDQTITYIGSTLCENDSKGKYRSNTVGEEKELFGTYASFLQEHIEIAHPIVSKIAKMGFFGNLGIDAMIYTLPDDPDIPLLHPIVEINARKTMGWAALMHQKRDHPNSKVRFSFAPSGNGCLPQSILEKNGKITSFQHNLSIEVYN